MLGRVVRSFGQVLEGPLPHQLQAALHMLPIELAGIRLYRGHKEAKALADALRAGDSRAAEQLETLGRRAGEPEGCTVLRDVV